MLVVLGGTRRVNKLPSEVIELVSDYIIKDSEFLVGDAPGIDKAFQGLLNSKNEKKVQVFTSVDQARNNVGNWTVCRIDSGLKSKGHAMHSAKDREMSLLADLGIMVWDTESAGTLSNIMDLVRQGKECHLYNLLENEHVKFDSEEGLSKYLINYQDVTSEANKRLNQFKKRSDKRSKINENFAPGLFD